MRTAIGGYRGLVSGLLMPVEAAVFVDTGLPWSSRNVEAARSARGPCFPVLVRRCASTSSGRLSGGSRMSTIGTDTRVALAVRAHRASDDAHGRRATSGASTTLRRRRNVRLRDALIHQIQGEFRSLRNKPLWAHVSSSSASRHTLLVCFITAGGRPRRRLFRRLPLGAWWDAGASPTRRRAATAWPAGGLRR